MTLNAYPNDNDQRALLDAQEVLAASGVAATPAGYDLTTLAAAIYARGWAYRIDRSAGSYQAEILSQRDVTTKPFDVGDGWSADVALAFALAQALRRQPDRGGPLPRLERATIE